MGLDSTWLTGFGTFQGAAKDRATSVASVPAGHPASLWMLIPGSLGITDASPMLATLCLLVAVVSTWKHCVRGSMLHHTDRYLARLCYLLLCFTTVHEQRSQRIFPSWCWRLLACVVFLCYATAQYCSYKQMTSTAFAAHLMFRFVGYWWTLWAIVPCYKSSGYEFLLNSLLYWGHLYHEWHAVTQTKGFLCAVNITPKVVLSYCLL